MVMPKEVASCSGGLEVFSECKDAPIKSQSPVCPPFFKHSSCCRKFTALSLSSVSVEQFYYVLVWQVGLNHPLNPSDKTLSICINPNCEP